MRPAPPEPNTPNTGRMQKYQTLVPPEAPRKRERAVTAALVASGAAAICILQGLVQWLI